MTSKRYWIVLISSMLVVYGVHFALLHLDIVQYNWLHFNVLDLLIFMFFIFGGLIMQASIKKNADNFVLPFMAVTTMQLLAILTILAATILTLKFNVRHVAFNLIGVFLAMLVVQTLLLISRVKSAK